MVDKNCEINKWSCPFIRQESIKDGKFAEYVISSKRRAELYQFLHMQMQLQKDFVYVVYTYVLTMYYLFMRLTRLAS